MSRTQLGPDPSAATKSAPEPRADLSGLAERLRATYADGRTRPAPWRLHQLRGLLRMLEDGEDELLDALATDMGKPRHEAWVTDLRATSREIVHTVRHLERWMNPRQVSVPLVLRPAKASVQYEPLGAVLVIAPWNYPVHLLLAPVVGALAAGNTVACKPSEVTPATSAALADLIPQYVDPEAVVVVEGGVPETTALLEQRWDHVFYTGNGTVGRIVAEAAAKHATPTTLELGGKSPAIVGRDANLKLAASRVAFAKWTNAGQTCVSADHVWVHSAVEEPFLRLLGKELKVRYGKDPRSSHDYGRIVDSSHTERLQRLLDAGGFELVTGGEVDVDQHYVAPTVLRDVQPDAEVMREEIFGPILPVLTFDDLDEPIQAISAGEKPLALYVFAGQAAVDRILAETSSGGVCVNEVMVQVGVSELPFGGVGESGYGSYHGQWGFETFSHRKSVLRRPPWWIDAPIMRPPYSRWKRAIVRRVF
jgi:aldehyde dehydrogenase (NAD+)